MFRKKRRIGRLNLPYNPTLKQNGLHRLSRRPHPLLTKIKRAFSLITVTAGTVLAIYALFFSNYFEIKEIKIINKGFENENLSTKVSSSVKSAIGRNIFFIDTEELELKILSAMPELEIAKIDKNLPASLDIEFSEYAAVANLINESSTIKKTYIINSIGYVIKEDFENPNLPRIRIKTDEAINTQSTVIEKNKINYIINAITEFESKFGMKISEAVYKPIPRELHLLTERDFYIWLDMQKSAEEQFKKLKKTLVKLDIHKENLQYIDLRIAGNNGDKIIYKRR